MKKQLRLAVLLLILQVPSFSGCKKAVEAQLDDAIVNAMISGQWVITSFK